MPTPRATSSRKSAAIPYAYTYRDYVIRAFNEDLPYDQFIVQQLAADRLPLGDDKRPLAALGYLTLGRRFLNNTHDIIDDRIDVTMRGFQAMTVGCARCHDHKFDPDPDSEDYYSLYGVFASSTEPKDLPVIGPSDDPAQAAAFERKLKKRQDAVAKFKEEHKAELDAKNRKFRDDLRKLENEVDEVGGRRRRRRRCGRWRWRTCPIRMTPHVFLRGKPDNPGPEVAAPVPRSAVPAPNAQPFKEGSGRLELARAIAASEQSADGPRHGQPHLAAPFRRGARPHAERLRRPRRAADPSGIARLAGGHVHGRGLVDQEDAPADPAVEHLPAGEHRRTAAQKAMDPENRLLSHMNRLRLEFEAAARFAAVRRPAISTRAWAARART